MVRECLECLALRPGMVALDGTFGTGGHAREIARLVAPGGTLIAMDRDPAMLAIGRERLDAEFEGVDVELAYFPWPYERAKEALLSAGKQGVHAAILDLGINSLQVDDAARGFSFSRDGLLDGRFNQEEGATSVATLVNEASERELAGYLRRYADERLAGPIARRIVAERGRAPIATTGQLASLVASCYPPDARHGRIHPATRTFQALRIAANDELGHVERGLRAIADVLVPGGTLAALAYHSGEDSLAKDFIRAVSDPRPDPSNPYAATTREGIEFEAVSRKAIECSDEEAARNPRARSAKLRAVRRIAGVARA